MSAIVLPEKLSELALLGLECLAKVEKQPGTYLVTMQHWHEPVPALSYPAGPCLVCFAGAVMAVRFGLSPLEWSSPGYFLAPNRGRLLALDRMRTGSLAEAALLAHLDGNAQMRARRLERPIPPYDDSPSLWRAAMTLQAMSLQEAGL